MYIAIPKYAPILPSIFHYTSKKTIKPIKSPLKPIQSAFSIAMLVYSQAKPPIFHGDVRPCFRRSGPAVSSALDNVALSLGDVIDAATQDTGFARWILGEIHQI